MAKNFNDNFFYAAAVKQDFYRGKRRTCTDFLSLYKFKEGWRIVSWTTYHHPEK